MTAAAGHRNGRAPVPLVRHPRLRRHRAAAHAVDRHARRHAGLAIRPPARTLVLELPPRILDRAPRRSSGAPRSPPSPPASPTPAGSSSRANANPAAIFSPAFRNGPRSPSCWSASRSSRSAPFGTPATVGKAAPSRPSASSSPRCSATRSRSARPASFRSPSRSSRSPPFSDFRSSPSSAAWRCLLFWNSGTPVASVPVEMYRLVASPLLPSIPLFTLAGYFMVQGGATKRLLRVFTALFSWIPGGLAHRHRRHLHRLHVRRLGPHHPFAGRPAGPDADQDALSRKLFHRTAHLVRLARPAVSHQRSRHPLLRLLADAARSACSPARFFPNCHDLGCIALVGVRMGIKSDAVREPFSLREAGAAIWSAKWELRCPSS